MNENLKNLFVHTGRINRGSYIKVVAFSFVLLMALLATLGWFAFNGTMQTPLWLQYVPILIYLYINTAATIKRLHDIGQRGWISVALLIPPATFLLLILLSIKSGTEGENKYGTSPS